MTHKIENGILSGAILIPSPNADQRAPGEIIDLLVIHNISLPPGEFGGKHVQEFFTNQLNPLADPYFAEIGHMKVSSHLFVERTGEVYQFVPFDQRAWHAGESSFQGRVKCNDFSIGIELEGTDDIPFTPAQYAALTEITALLQQNYPQITTDHIVGHSDIAPMRKTDPGPEFDWQFYRQSIES
jgi:AmpD protein